MKKYGIVFAFAAVVLLCCVALPDVMYSFVPKVNPVVTEYSEIESSITLTGRIVSGYDTQISAEYDSVVAEYSVECGDWVNEGDKICSIDIEATKELLLCRDEPDYEAANSVKTAIYATYSGRVSGVAPTKLLSEGDSVCTLVTPESLGAVIEVSENNASKIECGQRVIISGTAFEGEYEGSISTVAAAAEISPSGESFFSATVSISDATSMIKPGYSAKIRVITGEKTAAVTVPSKAVSHDENGDFVYMLLGKKAKKCYVECRNISVDTVAVTDGIDGGCEVAADAAALHGTNVNIRRSPAD